MRVAAVTSMISYLHFVQAFHNMPVHYDINKLNRVAISKIQFLLNMETLDYRFEHFIPLFEEYL